MTKRWKISNIPIDSYERLPQLRRPKGYVCVIYDLSTGNYYIEHSDHPDFLINKWRGRAPNRYKPFRILRTDNAVELKKSLHQRYKDKWIRQHQGWFRLDSAELRELDNFIAQGSKEIVADAVQLARWNLRYFAGDFYKHLPKLELPAGYVYVLRDLYTENYKIGYTNHPVVRIRYLEDRASGEVEYVHILQSDQARETEKYLHKRFDSCRTRSYKDWEWFQFDETQLREIKNLAGQQQGSKEALSGSEALAARSFQPQRKRAPDPHADLATRQASSNTQIPTQQARQPAKIKTSGRKKFWLLFVALMAASLIIVAGFYARSGDVFPKLFQDTADDSALSSPVNQPTTVLSSQALTTEESPATVAIAEAPACYFVYSCPSYDCNVAGQIASLDDMRFLQCVPGRDVTNTEWIELKYKDDKAYIWDRDCSSKNYSQSQTRNSISEEPAFTCDCFKKCNEMTSCAEAFFQLNECGCSYRDYDEDGIPCESLRQCD